MFESIKTILWQTPWWVYVLLYVLIQRGIAASKTQVVPFAKMAIIPAVFTGLSIYTIVTSIGINGLTVTTWVAAILAGVAIGWRLLRGVAIRVDRDKYLIEIPGSWRTLILIIIIFSCKYFFGYMAGAQPMMLKNTFFDVTMILVSGITSGMFIGNFLYYGQHYLKGPFATLTPTKSDS